MSNKLYDITSIEDISKQLSTMSTINESDLGRKKKPKKKRNSFVQMDAPIDITTKKLKKSSSRKKLKSNEMEYSDDLDDNEVSHNVQSNDRIFPVSNDWEEDNKYDINQTPTLRQPNTKPSVQPIKSGTMNLFDSKRSNFSYYLESNKRAILRCCPDTVINFNGVMSVKVLQGAVRIAGYTVTKKETLPIKVYSLNTYTYFPIELQSTDRNIVKKNKLTKALRDLNISSENIQAIISCLEPEHCLLYIENPVEMLGSDKILFHMLHRLNHSIPRLLSDRSHLQDLLEKHLGLHFLHPSGGNLAGPVLVQPPRWRDVFEQCVRDNQSARVVLCGGSGLGKTTLLRYLINRCLLVWGQALVIDLDPGQAEFYLPGTLSATVIREPVLGPNFTQLRNRQPERCHFLGDVKIHSSVHIYLGHVSSLLDYCHAQRSLTQMPWFVNTMGYVRDQGVQLNCRIIQDTRPTHVIQIQGKKPDENFPGDLTPQFVRRNAYRSDPRNQSDPRNHSDPRNQSHPRRDAPGPDSFDLVLLDSVKNKPFDSMNKCLKPADRRKLMLTAYFSSLFSATQDEYSVNQCTPYGTQIKHLQVEMTTKSGGQLSRGEILAAMNGELVALAASRQGEEPPQCLGYGIVYCIDPVSQELFLLSPLPLARMAQVKGLLLGAPSLSLPRKFLNPRCKELLGLRVPYTCAGEGQVTSQTTSRSYRQPARNRQRAQ